jgi:drug/metabolite transporter (DMT)-like permease
MLKAFTPVSVLILAFSGGLETPSGLQLIIVMVISIGVTLSAVGEARFNFVGFMLQLAGILSESLRLVLADQFLKDLKLDALSTLYYVAPPSLFFISIGFFAFEVNTFPLDRLLSPFAGILLLNGVTAFGLNVSHRFLSHPLLSHYQI